MLRQAVRLLRLADRAGGQGGHVEFLYVRVRLLRSGQFFQAIKAAEKRGALAGVVSVGEEAVSFLEPQMHAAVGKFDLGYEQMPMVAALLDIIQQAVGFERLGAICAGILGRRCTRQADDVARELDVAFSEWLKPRAENEHGLRQGNLISSFIHDTDRAADADPIGDETILEFWEKVGSVDAEVDGFRLYRNAARHLLIYRSGLLDDYLARQAEQPGATQSGETSEWADRERLKSDPGSWWDSGTDEFVEGGVGQDVLKGMLDDKGPAGAAVDPCATEVADTADDDEGPAPLRSSLAAADGWDSPLFALFDGPPARVKWLSEIDRTFLADLLSDKPPAIREADGERGNAKEATTLFVDGRPDPNYARTLARFSHFGRLQQTFADYSGKGRPSVLPGGDGYEQLREHYVAIGTELDRVIKAAAWVLLQHGLGSGVQLAHAIDPMAVAQVGQQAIVSAGNVRQLRRDAESQVRLVARALQVEGNPLREALRKAYEGLNRIGFKKDEFHDAEVVEAIAEGSGPLLELRAHVRDAVDWLAVAAAPTIYDKDLTVFHARFSQMYGTVREPVAEGEAAGAQSAPA